MVSAAVVVSAARRGIDVSGVRFGRLTAVERVGSKPGAGAVWRCACDCGAEKLALCGILRAGLVRSCGCMEEENRRSSDRCATHGHTKRGVVSPDYRCYCSMMSRCNTRTATGFALYGGRGIYVCARWRESFESFLADMGHRPSKSHSIDRIDNDGSYTCGKCEECTAKGAPANCRWADKATQARNRSNTHFVTIGGETLCLTDWVKRLSVPLGRYRKRVRMGWDDVTALTKPIIPYSERRLFGRAVAPQEDGATRSHDRPPSAP